MNFNSLQILTLLTIFSTVYCAVVTVHEDHSRTSIPTFLWWGGGSSERVTLGEGCINFNYYNNKISSIDPHDGCVKVWDQADCSGSSLIVTDKSGCSKNFAACDISNNVAEHTSITWDNKISSISSCSSDEETQANRPIDNGDLVEYDMRLVNSNNAVTTSGDSQKNLARPTWGKNDTATIQICKYTDCKRQERIETNARRGSCLNFGGDWDRKVSAASIIGFKWVTMYDGRDCTGESFQIWWLAFHRFHACRRDLSKCGWDNRFRSMQAFG